MSGRKTAACADCNMPIVGGKTGYCCHCAHRHVPHPTLKFPWTPEWDQMLRDAYARCVLGKPTVAIDKLQAATGYPRYIVTLCAQTLGITRDTRRPWTGYELRFLSQHAGKMTTRRVAQVLGRSYESVRCRMQALDLGRAVVRGYSIEQLAGVLGVSAHQVRKFIRRGWLIYDADRRIPKFIVRRLLAERMDHLDLRLMNQHWLKDELRGLFDMILDSARRAA